MPTHFQHKSVWPSEKETHPCLRACWMLLNRQEKTSVMGAAASCDILLFFQYLNS